MKYTLIEAIIMIARIHAVDVSAFSKIEYEDGSGKSFNYTLNGLIKYIRLP